MLSNLVFYQLVLIALVWVFLMLYGLWPSEPAAARPTPPEPVTPRRKRSCDPKPFIGLTRKPQPFQGIDRIRFSWPRFSQWRRDHRFCRPFVALVASWDRADVSCTVAG